MAHRPDRAVLGPDVLRSRVAIAEIDHAVASQVDDDQLKRRAEPRELAREQVAWMVNVEPHDDAVLDLSVEDWRM